MKCWGLPAVVLMDMELGSGMDGIEAAQIQRARLNLPVVLLTASAATEILARARLNPMAIF